MNIAKILAVVTTKGKTWVISAEVAWLHRLAKISDGHLDFR